MDVEVSPRQRDEALFLAGAKSLRIKLSEHQLHLFRTYYQVLMTWNRRVNLTAITDYSEVLFKHFLDSLSVLLAVDGPTHIGEASEASDEAKKEGVPVTLLDVGAGAGFPGLPLRIARPGFRLTLLESVGKKTAFLRHLLQVLELEDVAVITARAEDLAHTEEYREAYHLVVSRALDKLPIVAEYMLPFTALGGRAVVMKKGDISAEMASAERAITLAGGRLREVVPVHLPMLEDNRCLVVLEKIAATPPQYPRRAGIPAKRPL